MLNVTLLRQVKPQPVPRYASTCSSSYALVTSQRTQLYLRLTICLPNTAVLLMSNIPKHCTFAN